MKQTDVGEPGVSIVMYHRIGSAGSPMDIPLRIFENQLDYISDHFQVMTLDSAVTELAIGVRKPTAVITFRRLLQGLPDPCVPGSRTPRRRVAHSFGSAEDLAVKLYRANPSNGGIIGRFRRCP